MDYEKQSDEQLVILVKQGDEVALDFLLSRYKTLTLKIIRSYFLIGGEQEDLIQEAMIGLYKACLSYNAECGASFATFARKCMTRNVQTAVKTANRKKNQMLNNSLMLSPQGSVVISEDKDDEELQLVIQSHDLLPEEHLIEEEKVQEIKQEILKRLSAFELTVMNHYLKGLSYTEIAEKLSQPPKKIDNALTRIKNKLSYLKQK